MTVGKQAAPSGAARNALIKQLVPACTSGPSNPFGVGHGKAHRLAWPRSCPVAPARRRRNRARKLVAGDAKVKMSPARAGVNSEAPCDGREGRCVGGGPERSSFPLLSELNSPHQPCVADADVNFESAHCLLRKKPQPVVRGGFCGDFLSWSLRCLNFYHLSKQSF